MAAVAGDLSAAEEHYRRALRSGRPAAGAHFNLALLCERTGRPDEALVHYEAFLRTAGTEDADLVARAEARIRVLRARAAPR